MQIERDDGTTERRKYKTIKAMLMDAEKEARDPRTKKITLHFPVKTIPKKRRKKRK